MKPRRVLPKTLTPNLTLTISTLTLTYFFWQRESICREEKLLRKTRCIHHHHTGSEGLQAQRNSFIAPQSMMEMMIKTKIWDQALYLQQKLIGITKKRCMALQDLRNMMKTKTITENSGEFTSKTKTWWLISIKLPINVIRWTGKFSTSRTSMKTLLFLKFSPNLINSCTDFVNNSISKSCCWRLKRDKLEFNSFKSKNALKVSSKASRCMKTLLADRQTPKTKERSTWEEQPLKLTELTCAHMKVAPSSSARKEARTCISR